MSRLDLDSGQVLAELEALLEEISAPTCSYWPARKRLKRGIFLARAARHGLAFHLAKWDDYLSLAAEYGFYDPPTPAELELNRLEGLLQLLETREQVLLAEHHREQVLYHIRAYKTEPTQYFRSRRKFPSLSNIPLRSLPMELLALTELEDLSLHRCDLVDLSGIGQLTNLRFLTLSGNNLNSLPADFGQLQQLEWLNLDHNHLFVVEPLFQLGQLQNLSLFGNILSERDKARLRAQFSSIKFLKLDP